MKTLTLIDIQNMPISEMYRKYAQGYRMDVYGLGATCTKTTGIVGEIVHLKATPTAGTAPFTVRFYKDSALLTTFTNVGMNTQKLYDYTLVTADDGSRIFKTTITDSCPTGVLTCLQQCTVIVTVPCSVPSCNFVVE